MPNGAGDVSRSACGPRDIPAAIGQKRPKPVGDLPNRKIKLSLQILMLPRAQTPVFDVTDHADDLRLHIEQTNVEVFSDGILIGKILAGESSVDERDGGAVLVVTVGEGTAALDRNAHGLVVAWIHKIKERERHVVIVCGLGLAFEPERNFGISGHWEGAAHHGNGFHTAYAFELPQGPSAHGTELIRLGCGTGSGAERESSNVVR